MQRIHVFRKDLPRFVLRLLHHCNDLMVDACSGFLRARKRTVPAEVCVLDRLQSDHAETVAHAVPRHHGARKARCLLDVIGSARRRAVENKFLRRAAAGERRKLVERLFPAHEEVLAFLYLHRVSQCAGCARHDRDLMHGRGIALFRRHKRMADLMICHDLLLPLGDHSALALIAGDNDLYALFKIRLLHNVTPHAHRTQRRLVHDVRKLRAGSAARRPGNRVEIDVICHVDILCVYAQDRLAATEIRQFHRDAPVKPAGAQQGGVKGIRTVRRRKDDDTLLAVKTVHLREKLVQRLLALVVAAEAAAIALFADGIDLIDEHDAGSFLVRLLEQVAHLGGAHTHEHLHKFRTGNGEERHLRLTGYRLCKQRFACARRAHEQRALGEPRADLRVFARVVQEIHNLRERFLRLILTCNIRKGLAGLRLNIDLGIRFAEAHRIRADAAALQLAHHELAQRGKDQDRQNPGEQERKQRGALRRDCSSEFNVCLFKPCTQILIRPDARFINALTPVFIHGEERNEALRLVPGNLFHAALIHHFQELVIADFPYLCLHQHRKNE